VAGPMLDGYEQWKGFTMVVKNAEEGRHAVDLLHSAGVDFIKIHTQLSAETWSAVVARARELGIRFAGHVPNAVSAAAASDAGQASIEHLDGLKVACSSEEQSLRSDAAAHIPGPEGIGGAIARRFAARLVRSFNTQKCEALARQFAKNRTWVVPNLIGLDPASYFPQQANPRFKYIPDFLLGLWNSDPEGPADEAATAARRLLFQEDLDIVRLLRRSGVSMMTGTDCPAPGIYPGFSVHDDLAWLVRAGLTPAEALRAATRNPALFLNMSDRLGSVAERKLADLVLLDGDPLSDIRNTTRIHAIVADGRLFDRAALDKVLQGLIRKDESIGTAVQKKR
jgi:imidazolonepropionase-like amidohydrolase